MNHAKDTRAILEATIGKHLNDGLHFLVSNKYAVVCTINDVQHIVTLAEEPPPAVPEGGTHWFELQQFTAGVLSFFAMALGKENMSTS
jgi:hypothetical protein